MTQRSTLGIGIGLAFIAGIGITVLMTKPQMGQITGNLLDDVMQQAQQSEPAPTSQCISHDQCPQGQVCKLGACIAADQRFCSQDFMLAESLEGRFVRYTTCPNKCVRSGESAFCQ